MKNRRGRIRKEVACCILVAMLGIFYVSQTAEGAADPNATVGTVKFSNGHYDLWFELKECVNDGAQNFSDVYVTGPGIDEAMSMEYESEDDSWEGEEALHVGSHVNTDAEYTFHYTCEDQSYTLVASPHLPFENFAALLSPAHGSTVGNPVTLTWQEAVGATEYRVEMQGIRHTDVKWEADLSGMSIQVPILPAGTYEWCVEASGPGNGFTQTVFWEFTIEADQSLSVAEGWFYEGKRIDAPYLFDVTVVRLDDGRIRLYGEDASVEENGGIVHNVVSYLSKEGLTFQKEDGFRLLGMGFDPFIVKLPDGTFRLYYTDQQAKAIRSARSEDGLDFTLEEGDRLLSNGSEYERSGVQGPKVIQLSDGTYRMYYSGIDENRHARQLSATSSDGLHWKREEGVRWPDAGDGAPYLDPNGMTHLYIGGLRQDGLRWINGFFEITSTDGLHFTLGAAPIIKGYGHPFEADEVNPEDPAVIVTDQGLRMYFALYGSIGSETRGILPESGIYSVLYQIKTDINEPLEENGLPNHFSLGQNFPNPFNPTTGIPYWLPTESYLDVTVYDILGREVRTLVSDIKPAGTYSAIWDGKNELGQVVASGVYFYAMTAKSLGDRRTFQKIHKMTLIK